MRSVLFAIVLVLNLGGGDGPGALAGTDITAGPRSTDTPSSTREEQAIPTPGSRTAPDRPGPVPPPDLQRFPTTTAPNELVISFAPYAARGRA
jgi:hypothetical protein